MRTSLMGSVKSIGIIDVVSKRVDECSLTLSVYKALFGDLWLKLQLYKSIFLYLA